MSMISGMLPAKRAFVARRRVGERQRKRERERERERERVRQFVLCDMNAVGPTGQRSLHQILVEEEKN